MAAVQVMPAAVGRAPSGGSVSGVGSTTGLFAGDWRGKAHRPACSVWALRQKARSSSRSKGGLGILCNLAGQYEDSFDDIQRVSKILEKTARHFKNLGTLGFWSQLVCTFVSAGILSFSAVATGNVTAPFTFCATAVGIVMAFISVFQSYGYIRLSERLKRTANEPSKAPARADVVKNLRNSIVLNIVGMAAAVLGLQATVGALVGKALTTSAVPYYQGISPGQSPVLALDIFLVQASANTILSHFLGISSSLELLRSVTLPQTEAAPVPKPALRSVTLSQTEAAPVPKSA